MAQFKGTVVFAFGNFGWTEIYYPTAADRASAIIQLADVISYRTVFLWHFAYIQTAFVSDLAIRGDSTPAIAEASFGTYSTGDMLPPQMALMMKWSVGVFTRNRTFLRGFPADQQSSGEYSPSGTFPTTIQNYIDSVVANCYMLTSTPNPTPPPASVKEFLAIGGGIPDPTLRERKPGRPFALPRGRRLAPR